MQNALLVGRLEGQRDLVSDGHRLAERQGSTAQAIREALALDQLHDQEGHATVGLLETVKGGDARVIERGEDAGFLLQAREAIRLAGQVLGQGLEGDLAGELDVARAIDLSHSPAPSQDTIS